MKKFIAILSLIVVVAFASDKGGDKGKDKGGQKGNDVCKNAGSGYWGGSKNMVHYCSDKKGGNGNGGNNNNGSSDRRTGADNRKN